MVSIRDAVLRMAARAGMLMLRYGAETYRAEETISRICAAYGYESEPFALPTGVFAAISSGDQPVSVLLRIKSRSLHLNRVDALNAFAREVEKTCPPVEEALKKLDDIESSASNPKRYLLICYAITAAVFALLYGGQLYDAGAALVIGILLAGLRLIFIRRGRYPFFEYFVGGFLAGFLSLWISVWIPQTNAYLVMVCALINLMPGTALVSGLRDMLHGDSVSGLARLGEAILTVFILAAGAAIGLSALMGLPFIVTGGVAWMH